MAVNERQRQKKLATKARKKKLSSEKRKHDILLSKTRASAYAIFPIHECLIPDNLFEVGVGSILVSRKTPDGRIAFSAFVVDVYCLGVKNAFFKLITKSEYDLKYKMSMIAAQGGAAFKPVIPECVRKLIEGAVAYAAELGFSYHPDYKNAEGIFGDIDSSSCPENFTYGKDGKPFYMRGPHETKAQAQRIVEQLHKHCGEGGYHFLIALDEGF
jgi:hypothetical protein